MNNRVGRWPVVLLVLAGCAFLVLAPGLFGRTRLNDSFWIDWVWLDQFARELQSGTLYPRWLPLSHGGLGSPVFYYYPPLAFYLGSVFAIAGMQTYPAILATFCTASLISGIGLYLWLKGASRRPLVGAALFVVAPYHAADFYMRGAVAEHVAIAALPFVMLGLRWVAGGRRGGVALTGVSYAALILSHLPLALLSSVFLIGPYALWKGRRARASLLHASAGLAIGLAIGCVYLVPALGLDHYRDAAMLWQKAEFQPANWSLWNPEVRSKGYLAILGICASLALPAGSLALRERSAWAIYALVCMLLALGLVPFVWSLPVLKSVQFPFRIMPLAEFGVATAIAQAAWSTRRLGEMCLPLLVATAVVAFAKSPPDPVSIAQLRSLYPDVPENLPPGRRPYSWPSIWALDVASAHRTPVPDGRFTTEPVFFFPAWRVTCGNVPAEGFPEPGTQLLRHPGSNCSRRLVRTQTEAVGAIIGLIGFFALLISLAWRPIRGLSGRSLDRKGGGEEVTT